MRPSLRLSVPIVLAAFLVRTSSQAAPARSIYPLKQIRAGQRAVAKSVFKGTTIETFNLEIIGVLHKFEGTRSVILGRILDGTVVKRQSGVLQGMSGSPVYIGGKLAGAIALAWGFSKEPICGITPIEEMLEAWEPSPVSKPGAPAVSHLPQPIVVNGKKISRVQVESRPAKRDSPGTITLTPLNGYLQVSGFHRRAKEKLMETFEDYGLQLIDAPGGGGVDKLRPPLVPGAAVGAQLVRGDFDVSALGTVTMVEGSKVLAFGHPLFALGETDVPMTGGYVYDIMPNLLISNKIMAPTQVIGRIYRDHTTAIAGETRKSADMLPVVIEVRDKGGPWRKYSLEVIRLKEFMPILVAMSVMSAVDEVRGRSSRGSLRISLDLEFKDRPTIHRREVGYSDFDAAEAAVPLVLAPLTVFSDSPFGAAPLKRMRLRLEADDVRRAATIERVVVSQSRFKAGDVVRLTVTVRPYGKRLVELPLEFALPPDVPRGAVRVVITGGSDAAAARSSIGAPMPEPMTLQQLLDRYSSRHASFELVAQAALPRASASMLGEELPELPRGAYSLLQAARPTDLRSTRSVLSATAPTEWEISGRATIAIQVESDVTGVAPPGPTPPPAREEPTPEEGEAEEDESAFLSTAGGANQFLALARPPAKQTPKDTGKPESAKVDEKSDKEPGKDQKPLTSPPATWVQRTSADFARAKLTDAAVAEDGVVTLAPKRESLAPIPAALIWAIAVRDDVTYVGTGTEGLVHRVTASGEVSAFYDTGEMNVHALAFDEHGNLYAGTSPRGKLFRISPDGKGEVILDADRAYLWSLAVAPNGTIFAGTGSPARIYAIEPGGTSRVLADLPATNVLALALGKNGDVYAGTSEVGLVYRVKPDGTVTLVAQVPGATANALALDSDGNLYASSTPGGEVVRVPAAGLSRVYAHTGQPDVHGLGVLPNGNVIAATGPRGVVLRITGEDSMQIVYRPESGLASALAVCGNRFYVGSSTPAMVQVFTPSSPAIGRLESAVLDAERIARWGRIALSVTTPTGTAVSVETRAGDSPVPDDHWSGWAATIGGAIQSPPARYLQYGLVLSSKEGKASPAVREVRISRWPENRPPAIALRDPATGSSLSKKHSVKWQGRDPDQNPLVYDVAVSSDSGSTWKELKTDITDTKYEWDTAKTTDGAYLLRVTASDRRSQPWAPESSDDSVAVTIDNAAPTVMVFKSSVNVGSDKRARFRGVASDTLSPILSVEYRVDGGEWHTLPFAVLDSLVTDFCVTTDELATGARKIELRAFDAAGNIGTEKVEVKVAAATSEQKTASDQKGKGADAPPAARPGES